MEIELQDNNNYYSNDENIINNDIYKHSKLSNNPNEYHEETKPEIAFEDGGIYENKKDKKNWDISINREKDDNIMGNDDIIKNENNIDNDNLYDISNIKRPAEEEKIDEDELYQTKTNNIIKENYINKKNDLAQKNSDDDKENERNDDLIIDDDENLNSKNKDINNQGMDEISH